MKFKKASIFTTLVIAVLIQLGGLGLMTFAVLIWSALGRPLGITQGTYLREDLNQKVKRVMRGILDWFGRWESDKKKPR